MKVNPYLNYDGQAEKAFEFYKKTFGGEYITKMRMKEAPGMADQLPDDEKERIMQRFSVAGRRTFETMYFSEFFSDRLANLQVKHFLRRWNLGKYSNPQLVLITRHAIGDMSEQNNHYGIRFNTLEHGYSESGFEINNILT